MNNEKTGKMETHVSHDLSFRGSVRREYSVRDYIIIAPSTAQGGLR